MANKRILFVDDRPEHLRQPVLRLRLAGYEVDESASGDEGLAMLRAGSYGLVILDSELPNEDGWDVLRQVRKDPALADVKVIVFMAGEGETQQLVLVKVDAELRRPFALGALLDAVRRVIGDP
jgi:DNA-binding response OmpR family regulator